MLRFTARTTVKTSSIRAIFDRIPQEAQKWKDKGGFINLSIGQPDIDPNPIVLEKIEQDKTNHMAEKLGYTPTAGEPETLEAIVRLYRQYYPQVQYNTSEVMVTNGATGALSNVFSALVEKKEDTVLTFEPFFAAYTGQINEWEGSFFPKSSGITLFGLPLPDALPKNAFLADVFTAIHDVSAYCLAALILLHIAAVIKHRFFDKHERDILKRMW